MTASWMYTSLYNNEDFDYAATEGDYRPKLEHDEMKAKLDEASYKFPE